MIKVKIREIDLLILTFFKKKNQNNNKTAPARELEDSHQNFVLLKSCRVI